MMIQRVKKSLTSFHYSLSAERFYSYNNFNKVINSFTEVNVIVYSPFLF